jgi:hypothetical protein
MGSASDHHADHPGFSSPDSHCHHEPERILIINELTKHETLTDPHPVDPGFL